MEALGKKYELKEQLGKGSYAHVYRVIEKSSLRPYAVKIMDKERLGEKGLRQVKGEVEILRTLNHPNIVRLHEVCEDSRHVCLVMELITGGELLKRIAQLQHYSERTACELMRSLLKILTYMHDQGIVHRDLKPDNLLLKESQEDIAKKNREITSIKLADFGFAAKFRGQTMVQACGTPYYIAPELLQTGVYKTRPCYVPPPCDMWSAGVICYVLLCGYPPFRVARDAVDAKGKLFKQIIRGRVVFDKGQAWDRISSEAKNFILSLLVVDPQQRLTAAQAMEHEWFKKQGVNDNHLSESVEELKEFDGKTKLKGAVFGVEAAFRLLYTEACEKKGARQNSSLLEALESATEPLVTVDLTNNYLGPKGFDALISVINRHDTLKCLKLKNALLDTDQCIRLCKVLQDPRSTSKITMLDLSSNPLTHPAGRALLSMMQARRKVTHIKLEDTYISQSLIKKIYDQATRNAAFRTSSHTSLPAPDHPRTKENSPIRSSLPPGGLPAVNTKGRMYNSSRASSSTRVR